MTQTTIVWQEEEKRIQESDGGRIFNILHATSRLSVFPKPPRFGELFSNHTQAQEIWGEKSQDLRLGRRRTPLCHHFYSTPWLYLHPILLIRFNSAHSHLRFVYVDGIIGHKPVFVVHYREEQCPNRDFSWYWNNSEPPRTWCVLYSYFWYQTSAFLLLKLQAR